MFIKLKYSKLYSRSDTVMYVRNKADPWEEMSQPNTRHHRALWPPQWHDGVPFRLAFLFSHFIHQTRISYSVMPRTLFLENFLLSGCHGQISLGNIKCYNVSENHHASWHRAGSEKSYYELTFPFFKHVFSQLIWSWDL